MSLDPISSELDKLSLYFGEDYKINDLITVHNPTIGDVINTGERKYFSILHTLTAIPSDMKASLWDMEICWMDISDFDFFYLITRGITPDESKVFFGDTLDFSAMVYDINPINDEPYMYQLTENGDIVIDNAIYLQIVNVLRTIHGITPKIEKADTKTLRKILIDLNREDIAKAKNKPHESTLLPLVSSMINVEGFKYNLKEIKSLPYFTFMDSVKRVSLIKSTTALLHGCYGGMIDASKINNNDLNWLKDFETSKKNNLVNETKS